MEQNNTSAIPPAEAPTSTRAAPLTPSRPGPHGSEGPASTTQDDDDDLPGPDARWLIATHESLVKHITDTTHAELEPLLQVLRSAEIEYFWMPTVYHTKTLISLHWRLPTRKHIRLMNLVYQRGTSCFHGFVAFDDIIVRRTMFRYMPPRMTHAYHMRALIGALKPDYSFSLTQTLNAPRRDTYH